MKAKMTALEAIEDLLEDEDSIATTTVDRAIDDADDAIEELDDVQNVYANFDVSDEVMASLS